ncbi:helix-turn-helix transcriptional regulator [Paenibacillus protaetiae]|uniref:Transcriptional regulator n=1 Tax=Paenibacillus protaetiae TaxID=2509456 RepID=A0A4P6ES92_9BACL|nr:helix-turn-helix transcriptional regulator [Paenibacillus protaetiae]QAY65970.1 transcriptional regulator [Paenibacillus protaetiae]
MNQNIRLHALSAFLKSQRAKITPESAGFPAGTRRRTPGLRREEVAQLAGVSTTWYTWLEQGRDIKVSASVLDCIAVALQLTPDERKYMFSLALETGTAGLLKDEPPKLSAPLAKILQELKYCPAIITDRKYYIVGWNEAAAHVFVDFEQVPPEKRNMIRLLFERKELRRLAVNWEKYVSDYLAILRSYYGQYVEDEWYDSFISDMTACYPDFLPLWEQSKVSSAPELVLEFRHARGGKMLFQLTSLQVQGGSDLRFSVYTPLTDTTTEAKLKRLMR